VADSNVNQTQPYGALGARGHARLTVVAGRCPEGLSFSVTGPMSIGRGDAEISLGEAPEVSPLHARLSVDAGHVTIEDASSLNGVYLRIRQPVPLRDGDWFRVGREVFRFHYLDDRDRHPMGDGTLFFSSPRRKGTFRIVQVLEGGFAGLSRSWSSDEAVIGRADGNLTVVDDHHMSARHARIYRAENGESYIEDLGSTNGVFVRIKTPTVLSNNDQLFIGSELLRVDVA